MAYVELESDVYDLADPDFLNQLADNLDWLADPPIQEYIHGTTDGDYTVSTTFEMVAIDSTNMKFTFTSTGRPLICVLSFTVDNTGGAGDSIAFGLSLDDGRLGIGRYGGDGLQAGISARITGDHYTFTLVMPQLHISPGVHTIEPVWAVSGSTFTVYDDYTVFWGIWEI